MHDVKYVVNHSAHTDEHLSHSRYCISERFVIIDLRVAMVCDLKQNRSLELIP